MTVIQELICKNARRGCNAQKLSTFITLEIVVSHPAGKVDDAITICKAQIFCVELCASCQRSYADAQVDLLLPDRQLSVDTSLIAD